MYRSLQFSQQKKGCLLLYTLGKILLFRQASFTIWRCFTAKRRHTSRSRTTTERAIQTSLPFRDECGLLLIPLYTCFSRLRFKKRCSWMIQCQGSFRGGTPLCPFMEGCMPERIGTGFTLLKCFRTPEVHCIAKFYNYNLTIFLERISPDFRKSSPGAWTQASVSAWLASVSTVPVLRNDLCIAHLV